LVAYEALAVAQSRLPEPVASQHDASIFAPSDDDLPATLSVRTRRRLRGRYGAAATALVTLAKEGELECVPGTTTLWAALRWAARHEGVIHLDDLLLRRVRLGMQVPQGGAAFLPKIRGICQEELGWDDSQWLAEEAAYLARWQKHYSIPDRILVPDGHSMLVEARRQRAASLEEHQKHARQRTAMAVTIGVVIGLSAVIFRRRAAH